MNPDSYLSNGHIQISNDLSWTAPSWAYDLSLEHIAAAVTEADPALATKLLNHRTYERGGTSNHIVVSGGPNEKFCVLLGGAEEALQLLESRGPLDWNYPTVFPDYLDRFRELVEKLKTAAERRASTPAPTQLTRSYPDDPEILAYYASKPDRHAAAVHRNRRDWQPLLDDLRLHGFCSDPVFNPGSPPPRNLDGFSTDSLDRIVAKYRPLPVALTELLLRWLPLIENRNIKESVIRALMNSGSPFDGTALADAFDADKLEGLLRFPIAQTIARASVTGINEWLIKAVQKPCEGRGFLVIALAKYIPAETSLPILRALLDKLPGPVAEAFRECKVGGQEELDALKVRLPVVARTWVRKEFEKAIRAIERRLAKPKKPPAKRRRKDE